MDEFYKFAGENKWLAGFLVFVVCQSAVTMFQIFFDWMKSGER